MMEKIKTGFNWFFEKTRLPFGIFFAVASVKMTCVYVLNNVSEKVWFYNDQGQIGKFFVLYVTLLWVLAVWDLVTWWDER